MPALLPDWKDAWRWGSTRLVVIIALAPQIWQQVPEELKQRLPPDVLSIIITTLAFITLLVRIMDFAPRAKAQIENTESD